MRGLTADGAGENWLYPNLSDAENTSGTLCKVTATGFKPYGSSLTNNTGTYIYIAIRRGPMKVPTDATKVFLPSTAPATTPFNVGFPPDMALWAVRDGTGNRETSTRLQGGSLLYTNSTAAEMSGYDIGWASETNFWYQNVSGGSMINWMFRRAPSFFDEVCWTGTGSYAAQNHNLGVPPELVIQKARTSISGGNDWFVNTATQYGYLNLTNSFSNFARTLTATTFQPVADGSGSWVTYLFATCAGVSKVGSYTGTATTLQIDCGFTAGARFVLIKRTDSTGDWYVWDSARGIIAGNDPYLLLNSTAAEITNTDYIDTYSAGFEISSTAPAAINASGGTFIFLAIA
jgi:hypothetical protein